MTFEITVMSLDFDSDDGIQTKHFYQPNLTIGRSENCELVLKGDGVSAQHAKLQVNFSGNEPVIEIIDLESTNGTMIDNRPIVPNVPQTLKRNQRVMIGNYLIRPSIVGEFHESTPSNEPVENWQIISEEPITSGSAAGRIIPKHMEFTNDEADDPAYEIVPGSYQEEDLIAQHVRTVEPEFHMFSDATTSHAQQAATVTRENIFAAEPVFEPQSVAKSNGQHAAMYEEQAMPTTIDIAGAFVTEGVVNEHSVNLDIEAQRLLALRVRVEHQNKPLAGVKFDAGVLGEFISDANGIVEATGLLEGTSFALRPELKGYQITGQKLSGILDNDLELVFKAVKLCDIKGRITHHGQPLAGVIVDGGALGQVSTDAAGCYIFKDVPEGTHYKLAVKKAGFVFKRN